jgi:Protein of unknown function (DUF3040)
LREFERPFQVEDPEFTRSFGTRPQRLRRGHLDGAWFQIATVAAVLLGALMLVSGSPSGALAFAAVAGLTWLTRRRWNGDPDRSMRRPARKPEDDH